MAIKRVLTREQTESKIPLAEAYCKVDGVEFRVSKTANVNIYINTYGDESARKIDGAVTINKENLTVSLARFRLVGKPKDFTEDAIKAAAYRVLKAEGWTGEDC